MVKIDALQDGIRFTRKVVNLNNYFRGLIDRKAQAILVLTPTPRRRLFLYYNQLVTAFFKNAIFILDVIETCKTDHEPLRSILRTLIELYARSLYLSNNSQQEQLKRVLGDTLWSLRTLSDNADMVKQDRGLAKKEGLNLPTLKEMDFNAMKSNDDKKKAKELNKKFIKDWTFEGQFPVDNSRFDGKKLSVDNILSKYHDDALQIPISKKLLADLYSFTSSQVHGNTYLNMVGIPVDPKYQLIFLVLTLQIRFSIAISNSELIRGDNLKIDELILEAKEEGIIDNFSALWTIARKLNENTYLKFHS